MSLVTWTTDWYAWRSWGVKIFLKAMFYGYPLSASFESLWDHILYTIFGLNNWPIITYCNDYYLNRATWITHLRCCKCSRWQAKKQNVWQHSSFLQDTTQRYDSTKLHSGKMSQLHFFSVHKGRVRVTCLSETLLISWQEDIIFSSLVRK